MVGLLGRKISMTQVYKEQGEVIPVTVIEAGPCFVTQKKTKDSDGYEAVQLGYKETKEKLLNKAKIGHLKKAKVNLLKYLSEFKVSKIDEYEIGQEIKVNIFKEGELVKITGTTKGKGFTGVIKRWGFKGGRGSHGSMFHRAPGSIGRGSSDPSRVYKGTKLPGRKGGQRFTVTKLRVVQIDIERNLILVKGSVPGNHDGLLRIKRM
ncbi:MAG: 50S ribosomal protein L3 [bacterium]|nr:50S ribosomal protein L3 [bacterium]